MPRLPKRPCRHPACPALTEDGACPRHRYMWGLYDRDRGNAAQRGYGAAWARFRRWYLARHPLCVQCEKEGQVTPATDVDHIMPVTGPDDPSFFDETAVQGMCHAHHSEKTVRENRGFGRAPRAKLKLVVSR